MTRRRYPLVAAAAAIAIFAGACTSKGGEPAVATSGSSTPTATSQPPAGSGGSSSLTVTLANYSFTPSTVTVTSGATIHLQNSTPSTLHTFVVTGHGTDVSISAGSSQDVKIDLPPGTYPFVCRIHHSLGMTGTLIVG